MKKRVSLYTGFFIFLVLILLPPPAGLTVEGWKTAAVATLMAVWWITEAVPIPVTALLPIVLFPILKVLPVEEATALYANPIIFLFMGGFILAIGMQQWNLHKRIALNILNLLGAKPTSIVIGFIVASAVISMWVSNTATALMMLPIGISVMELLDDSDLNSGNFKKVLLLSIAYSCSIGGMGTLIGSPPNALLAGFAKTNFGYEISFFDWMKVGIPIMIVSLPLMYILLTKIIYPIRLKELPGGRKLIKDQLSQLGKFSNEEKKVTIVFCTTALLWIISPILKDLIPWISDAGIAMTGASVLFVLPTRSKEKKYILEWKDTKMLPWGILILFGGGLSLANGIGKTGLAKWIGGSIVSMNSLSLVLIITLALIIILTVTELMSNTAAVATFLPIVTSVAIGLGQNPLIMAIPITFAASCAFVLPVSTPPNAIVYGTGKISISEMAKAGIWLDVLFLFIILLAAFTIIPYAFGIK
jgi:sodium-dependent dicarboxylate transporter 2/3/5